MGLACWGHANQLNVVGGIGKYNISVVGILAECACVIRSPLHALPCQGLCCAGPCRNFMLGLEFVVRSQKMRAPQIPCNQAQILTSCIGWEPKCSRPAPTLGYMVVFRLRVESCTCALDGSPSAVGQRLPWATWLYFRLRVASCNSLHLNGCVRVLRLVAPALDWWHGSHFGSSATNQIDL